VRRVHKTYMGSKRRPGKILRATSRGGGGCAAPAVQDCRPGCSGTEETPTVE
jgi:hypothetical protein